MSAGDEGLRARVEALCDAAFAEQEARRRQGYDLGAVVLASDLRALLAEPAPVADEGCEDPPECECAMTEATLRACPLHGEGAVCPDCREPWIDHRAPVAGEGQAAGLSEVRTLRTVAAELERRDLVNMAGMLVRMADRLAARGATRDGGAS